MRSTPEPLPADLTTEARLAASADLDRMTSLQLVELMAAEDCNVVAVVQAAAPRIAAAIDRIAAALAQGGRLYYVGAGTSGRLGLLDAVECPPTFSTPPELVVGLMAGGTQAFGRAAEGAEDDPALGQQDIAASDVSARDVVVGITASGRTPYVLGALAQARARGATCIGIACNDPAAVMALVDLFVPLVVGPEILAGSTRLKAGTATKIVLNMLSTGAMVALGKTYGNLMVDVAATNTKLRARAERIVQAATGIGAGAAREALAACDGQVKVCIVSTLRGLTPAQARDLLGRHGGHVRAALEGSA